MFTAILSVAALFAVYAFVKPRAGCTHNCGMCPKACGSSESDHE
jgi:hypothetical protein